MNNTAAWIKLWEIILIIGFGSFALLVLVVIPLGASDIVKLFSKLDAPPRSPSEIQDES